MATTSRAVIPSPAYSRQLRCFTLKALLALFSFLLLFVYLLPLGNMVMTALSSQSQLSTGASDSVLPMTPKSISYQGQDVPIYKVPTDAGIKELALVKKGPKSSDFVDPANPDAGVITCPGNWRTLELVQTFNPRFQNFPDAWNLANFPRMFRNTLAIAVAGMIGTLLSCICVAYAFARFPIPGKNILFIILIAPLILPTQVTLIPTYSLLATISGPVTPLLL